jgi:tetratricopeptide (TPR) repeat protein
LLLWAPTPEGLPGLGSIVTLWGSEPEHPPVDRERLNIAITRFDQDGWTESSARLVVGTFQEFPELNVLRFERTISAEQIPDAAGRHAKALQYLSESGADVALWGSVAGDDGARVRVSVTLPPATVMETRWRRYQHPAQFDFPETSFSAVQPILRVLAVQLAAESRARRGDPPTDEIGSFVDASSEQLSTRAAAAWPSADRALAWSIVGDALNLSGTLLQRDADLEGAVAAYQKAVEVLSKENDAVSLGRVQNNLANVLATRGSRNNDTVLLEQAVALYKSALKTRTRDLAPLDWAATQSNLGSVLHVLGERQPTKGYLQEAVTAYRAALEERTAEKTPAEWGATQANLASVLQTLGEREEGTHHLEEAIGAYYAALSVQSRKSAPLDWAATQNNLGSALQALGGREGNDTRLTEAVEAYRAALGERRRDRAPEEWATTQNNLGNALQAVFLTTSDPSFLREAVNAYRAALEERPREKTPHAWGETQNNLGAALKLLGEREGVARYLEEAAEAYSAALEELSRERTPMDWAAAQNNLGNVLSSLGALQGDADLLCKALRHHANAWRTFRSDAPHYAEVTSESLRQDREQLDAINTRQTRRCVESYGEIFQAIGVS